MEEQIGFNPGVKDWWGRDGWWECRM